jgi:regulator of sirC expression with transglutaminase-like and TPR domain
MGKQTEINALISLLDDEDPEVFENVSNRIISYGALVIPELEHAWGDSLSPEIHNRIEELIHIIQFKELKDELHEWLEDDLATLLDGALIVSKYIYPDLDKDQVFLQLDKVRQKIWLELNNSYTPLENINIFNQVFYGILGFHGSNNETNEANDFCINSVLETKRGNSISLGILYLVLAQQLELPVYGVNLYRHFILAYQKNYVFDFDADNALDTIFYLNPINKGVPFQRREIKDYLKSITIEGKSSFYNPAPPKEILKELIFYMQFFFTAKHQTEKANEMGEFKDMF